ncbi:ComEC/Rec2 family competence protein [Pelagovum pacificum]|uniref:ComEC family competence protein n=1 Tax=Pelagovum pacificum TaxID=2588711 RepID=A0A5C5GBX2_9RHOB|nr:ComEC/Rec2 family competence protein [Pelagovum pacificum]QQA44606.1 ComEC/Rec2 family competence protein [Pelagovum pacificum]TNY32282.1 ComEC family competence protein [Pelagovum pacificum]
MRAVASIEAVLLAQRGHLFGWVPVCLGTGIGLYFWLKVEPTLGVYLVLLVISGLALLFSKVVGAAIGPIAVGAALIGIGVTLGGARAHFVAEPVLGWRYYGPVEGRVVAIDRSASDAVRLTLDQVRLEDIARERTPARVRMSLHGDQGFIEPRPGMVVILTGHLSPPAGPVEPGGFDFRRHAWFDRLGGIGYTRTPVLELKDADRVPWVARQRTRLSAAIRARVDGDAGAFAAAILTGDRSAIPEEVVTDLRRANLAHLLAISGLHMGLLTGVVFGLVRLVLALIPRGALYWPNRKIAALAALLMGACYLALSGGAVATERAYIMVAVMFVAVLFDRRAITLRAVAVAAIIVLCRRPEELTGPGFQMSFAATVALVAVFAALRSAGSPPGWVRPLLAVVLSSVVAGLATAPVAAAHFNQVSHYGYVANLLSVPVMGTVVIPAAVAAAILWPLGLDWLALAVMEAGLRWILWVAAQVSGLDDAVGHVPTPPVAVLPLLAIGAALLVLWRGRGRWIGLLPALLAGWLWHDVRRPDILIAETGGLIGVMTASGRALSKPTGDGFAAMVWLENDGAPIQQDQAAAKGYEVARARVGLLHLTGKRRAEALTGCGGARLLVLNLPDPAVRPCVVYDSERLSRTGAIAGWLVEEGLRLETAASRSGRRLWTPLTSKTGPDDAGPVLLE